MDTIWWFTFLVDRLWVFFSPSISPMRRRAYSKHRGVLPLGQCCFDSFFFSFIIAIFECWDCSTYCILLLFMRLHIHSQHIPQIVSLTQRVYYEFWLCRHSTDFVACSHLASVLCLRILQKWFIYERLCVYAQNAEAYIIAAFVRFLAWFNLFSSKT